MKRIWLFVFLAGIFGLCVQYGSGQGSPENMAGPVGWEAISGKGNEFFVFIPKGFVAEARENIYLGKPRVGIRVSKKIVVARQINGVVLMMEYYEGNANAIQGDIQQREKLVDGMESESGSFKIKSFSKSGNGYFEKIQHFAAKNSLYVLKAISPNQNDRLAAAFFESVRIQTPAGTSAPNAPNGATSTTLPDVVERNEIRLDDSQAIEISEADRKPIIIRSIPPRFTADIRRGLGSIRVKMKVLFSSSGKVTNVEVLESSSKLLNEAAITAVKQTVFIPAARAGKLVSVYQTMEHSFEMTIF